MMKHKSHFFIAAVFLLTALLGIPAAAETFRTVGVGPGTSSYRTKVGSIYFWGKSEGEDYYIMTSESDSGEGEVLAEVNPWDSVLNIMTDGETVIYPSYDFKANKTIVSKINADGTGKTTLDKTKINGYSELQIVKKYKSKYYYTVGEAIYCINQTTGKNTRFASGKKLNAVTNKSSKYVYAVITNAKSVTVKTIDSHTMKVKSTQTVAAGKGFELFHAFVTKKYLYLAICNAKGSVTSFYRMPAAGKGKIKLIGTLELTNKDLGFCEAFVINDKYAYSYVYDEDKDRNLYYKYMFANRNTSKISERVYNKATKKLRRW